MKEISFSDAALFSLFASGGPTSLNYSAEPTLNATAASLPLTCWWQRSNGDFFSVMGIKRRPRRELATEDNE